jgi:hypothetical protein
VVIITVVAVTNWSCYYNVNNHFDEFNSIHMIHFNQKLVITDLLCKITANDQYKLVIIHCFVVITNYVSITDQLLIIYLNQFIQFNLILIFSLVILINIHSTG